MVSDKKGLLLGLQQGKGLRGSSRTSSCHTSGVRHCSRTTILVNPLESHPGKSLRVEGSGRRRPDSTGVILLR